ncbi:hypothetical protein D3C87_1957130 [compost metagenome]
MSVDALFGTRALASCPHAFRYFLVFFVQAKLHGSQNDIQALQNDMVLGVDFRDPICSNRDSGLPERPALV